MSTVQITIGSPEFWPDLYKAYGARLHAMLKLPELINQMFVAAHSKGNKRAVERVVGLLTRISLDSKNDVFVLCGNGSGVGALKIVRGMFESSSIAEYLRLHPDEAQDFEDFRHVIAWRRYQWMLNNTPTDITLLPERIKTIQDDYDRIKNHFTNTKGRVRSQWSKHSFSEMTKAIRRHDQYELVYSWLSSLHHVNHEGMMAHVEAIENQNAIHFVTLGPPSLYLVK